MGAFVSTLNPILGQPEERGASPLLYAAASPDLDGEPLKTLSEGHGCFEHAAGRKTKEWDNQGHVESILASHIFLVLLCTGI